MPNTTPPKIKMTTTYEDGYMSMAVINDHTMITYTSGDGDIEDDRITISTNNDGLTVNETKELVNVLNKMLKGL
jgi:hypothetical protein